MHNFYSIPISRKNSQYLKNLDMENEINMEIFSFIPKTFPKLSNSFPIPRIAAHFGTTYRTAPDPLWALT